MKKKFLEGKYCKKWTVNDKINNFADNFPEIAKEWHPTKNGDLKPTNIVAGSHKKVWWLCKKCGHEWNAFVYSRKDGRGCPQCGLKKISANTQK